MPRRSFLSPLLLALMLFSSSCARNVTLSQSEREIAKSAQVPEAVAVQAKRLGSNLRRADGADVGEGPVQVHGITIDVPPDKTASVVASLRQSLDKQYMPFVSDRNFGLGGKLDAISILKVSDPFDALRAIGTNGANYDITTEMVIARLKEWDAKYGLTLTGIGFDWVEASLQHEPSWKVFADEVYRFCPDVVDQGVETVAALAQEMKRTKTVYLWWD